MYAEPETTTYAYVDAKEAEKFTCSICLDVCRNCVQCSGQGHRFCEPCAKKLVAKKKPCPLNCAATPLSVYPDPASRREIAALLIRCMACKKTMKVDVWNQHLANECDVSRIACTIPGCTFRGKVLERAQHMEACKDIHLKLYEAYHASVISKTKATAKTAGELVRRLRALKRSKLVEVQPGVYGKAPKKSSKSKSKPKTSKEPVMPKPYGVFVQEYRAKHQKEFEGLTIKDQTIELNHEWHVKMSDSDHKKYEQKAVIEKRTIYGRELEKLGVKNDLSSYDLLPEVWPSIPELALELFTEKLISQSPSSIAPLAGSGSGSGSAS